MRTPRPWILPLQPTSTADLCALGVTQKMVATRVRTGELLRIRQGVYVAASAWPAESAEQHLLRARAEIAANPAAVLSHGTAAVAWSLPSPGFARWEDGPVSVTLPSGAGFRPSARDAVHHVAALPPTDVTRDPEGYRLTSLTRTAVDLSAGLPLPEQLVILDAAARILCSGYVSQPRRHDYTNPALVQAALDELRRAAIRRHRTGLLTAIGLAQPARESAAESLSAGWFSLADLPTPEYQRGVATSVGIVYPDALWRGLGSHGRGVVGECDGAIKYRDASAYVQEKEREQLLRDLGFDVVRWLAKEIMLTPDAVVARVARALGC